MEWWDLLDENGNKTGQTMLRGGYQPRGRYHLAVHVWAVDRKGRYLIQKRSMTVHSMPGKWAMTGGSVIAGEESLACAVRETKEELGVECTEADFRFVKRMKKYFDFVDIYLIDRDMNDVEFHLQQEEVSEVRWVTKKELSAMIRSGEFHNYGAAYFELLFAAKR